VWAGDVKRLGHSLPGAVTDGLWAAIITPGDAFPGPMARRRNEFNVLNTLGWRGQEMCRLCRRSLA
jgi:hypothetical protein